MIYTVKNVKGFQGLEGYGYECSLYKDGKKIGTITDTANGGMADYYLDKGEKEILDKHCETLPKIVDKYIPDGMEVDADMFVGGLVDKYEADKQIKRWCKTQIVYTLKGDEENSYRTIKAVFSPKTKELMEKKFANKGLVILNERY